MTLSNGTKLSHYEISSLLGRGGMGEVYKAKDQKLGRDVAIKVLPEEFAKDTDRVARFQREAKLLASLNHPSIASIYGLEESDGTHFLVLELVEGDTLADQIKKGPLPVEEALKLALQIAEALEAAHEKGVIHRDLKPANIKVTLEGKIKVLDFGLAKAFASEKDEMILSDSPTLSVAATQKGVILGTAAYMSPEQAKGKSLDRRTDVWAFGCVLYEMITGEAAFQGEDVTEILASVVKASVDLEVLPKNLHPRVRELLTRCLQKDQKKRYRDIGDARYEIEHILADPAGMFVQTVCPTEANIGPKKIHRGIASVVITAAIAGVAVWTLKPEPPPEPKQIIRFEYDVPEDQQFSYSSTNIPIIAVSPDGSQLVYGTTKGLFLRSLDAFDAIFIKGTEGRAINPFFSPDGQWIGYYSASDQKLKIIPVSGGFPKTLVVTSPGGGFSWGRDNRILHGLLGNIFWISDEGDGNEKSLIEQENSLYGSPQMLPGGEAILFVNHSSSPFKKIMVHSLNSGKSKELLEGTSPRYIKTGHIVYGSGNDLYAVPFDPDTLETTGNPKLVIENVLNSENFYNYAISDNGTLAYLVGGRSNRIFVWVDREGNEEPLAIEPNNYVDAFKLSHDGKKLAVTLIDRGNQNIYIFYDLAQKAPTKFTFDDAYDTYPIWTDKDNRIIFASHREKIDRIFGKAANGGNVEPVSPPSGQNVYPWSISGDGKTLFLTENNKDDKNISMLSMEGDRTPKLLLQEKYNEDSPQLSPDSKWLAYISNETGRDEVWVRPFPKVDSGRWQISKDGGQYPIWSPDGRELFYRSPDAIMAVSVKTEPDFKPETPVPLFPNKYIGQFDIHPSGEKFLMVRQVIMADDGLNEEITPRIKVITNWVEELKQKAPVP